MSKLPNSIIPYSRQYIDQEDLDAVAQVVQSDWLTQGPTVREFEEQVASYCGAKYALAVSSGTAALHLACLALEPKKLWTSPNTFVASANCGLYCGAKVDFVDIDPKTLNICPQKLEDKLKSGDKPDLLVPVHFSGRPVELDEIKALADKYDFKILEDASHALGATYKDASIGSCVHSEASVFSFHPVKGVTTGEGGMIVTNDKTLYDRVLSLRSHGIERVEGSEPWYYEQKHLGFNYRITDIQAALGVSQLKKLDAFVERRIALAAQYDELLAGLPIQAPLLECDGRSAWHLYPIQIDLKSVSQTKEEIFNALLEKKIRCQVHYIPVHTQPYYKSLGFSEGDFPNAENYYKRALSIPMFYALGDEEQQYVADSLKEVLL